jgi:hypothetical protein
MDPGVTLWNIISINLQSTNRLLMGTVMYPRNGPTLQLDHWVGRQHEAKHQNKLNAEREAKPNTTGFAWSKRVIVFGEQMD